MKGDGSSFAVSLYILFAAIFAIFYAVWVPIAVRTISSFVGFRVQAWITFVAVLIFSNAGTYVFVSAVPSYLLRRRNMFLQFLAHLFSSTVASLVEYFIAVRGVDGRFYTSLSWLQHPVFSGLYLAIPFIFILYMAVRSAKSDKGPQ